MRWRLAAAATSGVLAALAFPAPGLWPLAFVAWAPLLAALEGVRARRGAALGLVAGLAFFVVVLRWLEPLTDPGWFALSAYLAAYVAAFAAAASVLLARRGAWPRLAVPAAWVAIEWMRGWLGGGFGWAAMGYALAPAPRLVQLASIGGTPILSLALMASNAALAAAWPALRARAWRLAAVPMAVAVAPIVALSSYGLMVIPATRPAGAHLRAAVVQAAVSPRGKWARDGLRVSVERYVALSDRAAADAQAPQLIVWPETAFPAPLDEGTTFAVHSRGFRQRVEGSWNAALLFGALEPAGRGSLWNSAFLYAPGDVRPEPYRKRRLVPFAEYTPFPALSSWFPRPISGPEIVPGPGGASFEVAGARVGVLICFEDLFADDAIARAAGADVLAVITNDAWFGSSGLAQHLDIAVLRAVETRRAIARAANTGISALVDPYGRVIARTPGAPGEPDFVAADLPLVHGTTLYSQSIDAVPLAALALALFALADVLVIRRRR